MPLPKPFYWLILLLLLPSCDMEKEINVMLPYHEPQLVVECYLSPGRPFIATVLESSNYFDAPVPPLVPGAEVYITTPAGARIKLDYKPNFNDDQNFYTHISTQKMLGKPGDIYALEVIDGKGRRVTGFTTVLPVVTIQEITWKFNDKEKAYLLTTFQDNPETRDFYRYMTHRNAVDGGTSTRDFATSDKLNNGEKTSYGSGYDYEAGDTLVVSLFHIEEQYYDFVTSTEDAKNANGNPFAQPSKIRSSVEGGIGIFTNLAVSKKKVIIK